MSARLYGAALLAALAPLAVHAQTAPAAKPVVVPAPAQPALDPARLAAAEKVVAKLVPQGVYKRMLGDNFGNMMGAAMDSIGNMPALQLVQLTGIELSEAQKLGEGTVREVLEIYDPAWQKRMTASTSAFSSVMGRVAGQMEPAVRKALARAYAREFSIAELAEMDRFFATPAGAHYAAKSLEITMDPEMMTAMTEVMPQMMEAMPEITKEMQAVEASLPKARKYSELSPAEQKRLQELLGVDAETLEAAETADAMTDDVSEDLAAELEATP